MKHIRFIDGILRDYTAGEADPEKSGAAQECAGGDLMLSRPATRQQLCTMLCRMHQAPEGH